MKLLAAQSLPGNTDDTVPRAEKGQQRLQWGGGVSRATAAPAVPGIGSLCAYRICCTLEAVEMLMELSPQPPLLAFLFPTTS